LTHRLAHATLLGGVVAGLTLAGCGGEPEAQVTQRPVAAPAPPPPPPKPALTPVSQLMAQLSIDERIVLAEEDAPDNDPDRIAVLEFFDAFARGDVETLGTMMSALDQVELEALASSDVWEKTVDGIVEITLDTAPGPFGEKCALAVFEVETDFQPQLWYYTSSADGAQFEAAATPPDIMGKLHGEDWIAVWHQLLEEERLLANKLDVEIERAQVVLAQGSGGNNPGARAPSSPKKPGFGPSPGGGKPDRRPPGKKRKPPGAR
jgi:hypothetical protein